MVFVHSFIHLFFNSSEKTKNGFDNSGQLLPNPTCKHWSESEENVKRSLKAVDDITKAIVRDGIRDVVTGFGILNEPFLDCDEQVVRKFYDEGLNVVRKNMGRNTSVFIGDLFDAKKFNDGFWIDGDDYNNTFLDSHYYHGTVFFLLGTRWFLSFF